MLRVFQDTPSHHQGTMCVPGSRPFLWLRWSPIRARTPRWCRAVGGCHGKCVTSRDTAPSTRLRSSTRRNRWRSAAKATSKWAVTARWVSEGRKCAITTNRGSCRGRRVYSPTKLHCVADQCSEVHKDRPIGVQFLPPSSSHLQTTCLIHYFLFFIYICNVFFLNYSVRDYVGWIISKTFGFFVCNISLLIAGLWYTMMRNCEEPWTSTNSS